MRQVLLQSATAFFITKCDGLLLQSATAFLLQSAASVITKCDRYCKVRRFLQSATEHTLLSLRRIRIRRREDNTNVVSGGGGGGGGETIEMWSVVVVEEKGRQ